VTHPIPSTRYDLYIDGAATAPASGQYFEVTDPTTRLAFAEAARADRSDVDRAVASARRAFEGEWATWRAADRAAFLIRFGQLIGEHAEELAELQVRENGKLMREMLGQTKTMPEYFTYYAGLAQQPTGVTTPVHLTAMMNYTVREPIGVVAAITPWNSPLMLLAYKVGCAIAAGCTLVVKPSEITPVSTVRFAELATEAGLPAGVFNVVTGLGDVGAELTRHPGVDKIAFTGSTATGQAIAATAATTMKRLSLELGGKSPNILFEDADIDSALNGIMAGIFGASGQTCMAGSRVLVQESIYDRVVDELARRAEAIRIGDPRLPETQMGTVASEAQYDKVLHYIGIARDEGARVVAGGGAATVDSLPDGLFIRPTVLADVDNAMTIAREEVFGPVAAMITFRDEDDAVRIANDTDFGLAAGIWTKDVARAHRVASRVRAGTVWINNYRKSGYSTPFGGFGMSGLGRENGPDSLDAYTEVKSVWVDLGQGVKDPFDPRA